jgi:hypothetical protein
MELTVKVPLGMDSPIVGANFYILFKVSNLGLVTKVNSKLARIRIKKDQSDKFGLFFHIIVWFCLKPNFLRFIRSK